MNAEKKKYITPSADVILTAPYVLSSFSGNVIHDDNTQKDRPGPGTGGDEEHSGGDDDILDGAKGFTWQWTFKA